MDNLKDMNFREQLGTNIEINNQPFEKWANEVKKIMEPIARIIQEENKNKN